LYEPGEVASFEGVSVKDLSNPVPEWAEHRPDDGIVPYGIAPNMNTPNPDSGEEYPHINTQLFGILDEENRGKFSAEKSFNEPSEGQAPTMDGFVADFISMLTVELGRPPTHDEYAQIMTGYTPEQMPVLSGLARGFATFDHWFCDVPTCTYPNRSFFHAGQSSGFVVNMSPPGSFPKQNDAETLFDRLDAAGLSWRVYCDPPSHYSLTGVIHAPRLAGRFATNFFSTHQFFADAESGQLPTYSFIEPQIIGWKHNDMHPPFGGVLSAVAAQKGADASDFHFDPPSSLVGGEDLLARIYNAIRSSSSDTGSNHLNTTLLVAFDEHGGTYDHVPPPPATPPHEASEGEMGFGFDRLGCRVPAIAVSAYTRAGTIVHDEMHHAAVIATLSRLHGLKPLTRRDVGSNDLFSAVNLDEPRPPITWPSTTPQYIPPNPQTEAPHPAHAHKDKPLSPPARGLLGLLLAKYGTPDEEEPATYADAYELLHRYGEGLFGTPR
jgi:phospholipase C